MVMLVALSRVKAVLQGQRVQGMGTLPGTDPICALLSTGGLQGGLWWVCGIAAPSPCRGWAPSGSGDVLCSLMAVGENREYFSVGRERSSSEQALLGVSVQGPAHPDPSRAGALGCCHEQFSVPSPVCALGQISWFWPGQEREM